MAKKASLKGSTAGTRSGTKLTGRTNTATRPAKNTISKALKTTRSK
jgi:hypothetical protein